MADLNEKQKRFVKEYVKDFNGTKAAIRAGYSENSAKTTASEILTYPYVQQAIQKEIEKRNKRIEVSQDRVVEELAKIAFSDIKDFVTFGPSGVEIKSDQEVDGTVLAEISEIKTSRGTTRKVKPHDKMKALELLGRHLGIYKDINKIEIDNDFSNLSDEEIAKLMNQFGLKPEKREEE